MRHDEFIGRVQERTALPSREAAEGLTRATLEALGERLSPELAGTVADRLPSQLGVHLRRSASVRGVTSSGHAGGTGTGGTGGAGGATGTGGAPTEMPDAAAFLQRVTQRCRASEHPSAEDAHAVLMVLDEAVPQDLVREMQSALPADLVASLATDGERASPVDQPDGHPGRLFGDRSSRLGRHGGAGAGVNGRTGLAPANGRTGRAPVNGRTGLTPVNGRTGLAQVNGRSGLGQRGGTATPTLLDALRGVATLGGVVVALAMWLVLGFALIGMGLADPPGLWLGLPIEQTSGAWWSITALAVALLIGGMAGGLGIASPRSDAALVQGVLVWALVVLTACLLAWMDIGVDLGPIGRVIRELRVVSGGILLEGPAFADIRTSAGYAVIAVTLALITSCAGALIGWLLVTAKNEVVSPGS